ncbi:S-glutathionyl-(chloro)hydroquinone reductase [Gryganskiella cystojenkinii]|nr:S-glutathionyl-(chloro)hydroquinone reductase [Gryganskiella cystojenkinii]
MKAGRTDANGELKDTVSSFRDWIRDTPDAKFQPEKGRYHLYISHGCPWAHRTALVRVLKGLEDVISADSTHWQMGNGWSFQDGYHDSLFGAKYMKDLYLKANPDYSGRITVPVLWDKKTGTIVNNESSEIIRMLNSAFNKFLPESLASLNFYPEHLQKEIDEVNSWIFETINVGVYKTGLATTQEAYEKSVYPLFTSLDRIENEILSKSDYLVGNTLTEADVRLWTTIVRFDPVYHGHFKCNLKGIEKDYPNILKWTRRIYQMPKVGDTVKIQYIKNMYYASEGGMNTTRVVPVGNGPNLSEPKIL